MSEYVFFSILVVSSLIAAFSVQLLILGLVEHRARILQLRRTLTLGQSQRSHSKRSFRVGMGRRLSKIAALTTERISIMGGGEVEASAELLRFAGFRSRDAVLIHTFLKLVLPIFGGIMTVFWLVFGQAQPAALLTIIIWVACVALMLSKAPDVILARMRDRRFAQIRKGFPDLLELLVIASEAGLSAGPALTRVAREISSSSVALSIEIQQLAIELNVLPDRRTAWTNLALRLPLPEVSVFCNTLLQAERYGTPFAGALRTLMREERASRLLRIEEKAGRVPALMTIPLIVFIMPALFMVIIGPAVLNIMDTIINGGF